MAKSQAPPIQVLSICHLDEQGDFFGASEKNRNTLIRVRGRLENLAIGDRALCRIHDNEDQPEAEVMKKLPSTPNHHLGLVTQTPTGFIVRAVGNNARKTYHICKPDPQLTDQLLVWFRPRTTPRAKPMRQAEIIRIIGIINTPQSLPLIALHEQNLPIGFSTEAETEARNCQLPTDDSIYQNYRELPFITIDPDTAQDFDDAVFATRDREADNPGGWLIYVAIADVSAYIRQGSALDNAASKKGNSIYFPAQVEPMLPEVLSHGLCSLRPHEDKACLVVKMRFNSQGQRLSYEFERAFIRSQARLTYTQAQNGFDGKHDADSTPVAEALANLHAAYQTLIIARTKRAPLDINIPEYDIHINTQGDVSHVTQSPRFTAHKLIEEFMIEANCAAAEALTAHNTPSLIRVHPPPESEKLQALTTLLDTLKLPWKVKERIRPAHFNRLLTQAQTSQLKTPVSLIILRAQSQAYYSPTTQGIKGHFGLNRTPYTHFTSPIRRYSDIIVHRALIHTFRLDHSPQHTSDIAGLDMIAEHVSATERRALIAERDTRDRYMAHFLKNAVGTEFDAYISSLTRFGLFVTLPETGADGFIPIRHLEDDHYLFDSKNQKLIGRYKGGRYHLGYRIRVRLVEINVAGGQIRFATNSPPQPGAKPKSLPTFAHRQRR